MNAKDKKTINEYHKLYHAHMLSQWPVHWLGVRVEKPPEDLLIYADIIFQQMPDIIVEIGTRWGGSALWFACIMDIIKHGEVITIDINPHVDKRHPRVRYVKGDAHDPYTYQFIEDRVGSKKCMVSEDSNHSKDSTLKIMDLYGDLVTPGYYMVVEDINQGGHPVESGGDPWAYDAVVEFMKDNDKWEWDREVEKHLYTWNAWLRRK